MPGALRAIDVEVGAAEVDLVSGLLWGAGVGAVAEHPGSAPDRVRLRCDVPPGGLGAVRGALGRRWTATEVAVVDDGLDAWREHAVVARAGARLVVRPPWLARDARPHEVEVVVDPGRSFGHGDHPTTRLCLAALEPLAPGARVLDVGCGSGVLAVAAAALRARRVVGVDIAPEAVEATAANAVRNGVEVEVLLGGPERVVGERFDLVVANVGAGALVALAPTVVGLVAEGGTVVLSGLLDPPPPEVAAAHGPLGVRAARVLDGWAALTLG